MAYETGSYSGMNDLLSKVDTFLVANGWTRRIVSEYSSGKYYYIWQSGSYQGNYCFIGLKNIVDTGALQCRAYTDYSDGLWDGNVNPSTTGTYVNEIDVSGSTGNYKISCNARRFLLAAGLTKECFIYGGFFKPYASLLSYTNPIYISCSSRNQNVPAMISITYSQEPVFNNSSWDLFDNPGSFLYRTNNKYIAGYYASPYFNSPDGSVIVEKIRLDHGTLGMLGELDDIYTASYPNSSGSFSQGDTVTLNGNIYNVVVYTTTTRKTVIYPAF